MKRTTLILWGILGLTAVLLLAFLFDWWPALRGGYGWRWPYLRPTFVQLPRLWPALLALSVYLAGLWLLGNRRTWLFVLWCLGGALIVPVALLVWWGDPLSLLFTRTVSGLTTGGFAIALHAQNQGAALPLSQLLADWPALMPTWEPISSHMVVSPPGWPFLYYQLMAWGEHWPAWSTAAGMAVRPLLCDNVPLMTNSHAQLAAAWLGMAAPLWLALAVLPLYGLARQAAGDRAARWAIAWWPLVPSLSIFLGTLNSPYPLAAATIVWLLWAGLRHGRSRRAAVQLGLAGALTAVAILFSFAFAPLLLFAGLLAWIVGWKWPGETWAEAVKRPFLAGIQFGAGLLLIFALYRLWAGHTPLAVWQATTQYHFQLERAYWPWLWLHSWDFIIFFGLPAFALFVLALFHKQAPGARQMALALALTLGLVVLSGTARGETGRIWSLFMPVALVGTAAVLADLPARYRPAFTLAQTAWLVGLFIIIPAVGSDLTPPPAYTAVAFPAPAVAPTAVSADFGDVLHLQGYSAEYDPQTRQLALNLYWEARRQMATPYFFSAILVAPDGRVLPAVDWQPFAYQFPTTCWYGLPAPIMDRVFLPLDDGPITGDWWLSLRVFALGTDNQPRPLPVTTAGGAADEQIGLGPIPLVGD